MLSTKQARHSLYLTALQYGGVLQLLPPNVLATLFEHAQMLAAAARVLEYHCTTEAAPPDQEGASQGDFFGVWRLLAWIRKSPGSPACTTIRPGVALWLTCQIGPDGLLSLLPAPLWKHCTVAEGDVAGHSAG